MAPSRISRSTWIPLGSDGGPECATTPVRWRALRSLILQMGAILYSTPHMFGPRRIGLQASILGASE